MSAQSFWPEAVDFSRRLWLDFSQGKVFGYEQFLGRKPESNTIIQKICECSRTSVLVSRHLYCKGSLLQFVVRKQKKPDLLQRNFPIDREMTELSYESSAQPAHISLQPFEGVLLEDLCMLSPPATTRESVRWRDLTRACLNGFDV